VNSELLCYTGYGITSDEKKLLVAGYWFPASAYATAGRLVAGCEKARGMGHGAGGKGKS